MDNICSVCESNRKEIFSATLISKYQVKYYYCKGCGLLQTEKPYWLSEAYSRAIASTDTGLVQRNISLCRKLTSLIYFILGERGDGHYLDLAGGYGLFTRLMRDNGFDFYWTDKYCDNILAVEFDGKDNLVPYVAITAIEVLEHVINPIEFIQTSLGLSHADTFIFTTMLYADSPPLPGHWWYYSLETGQHISFYQERTLQMMADILGMDFSSAGNLHVFSKKPINKYKFKLCTGFMSYVHEFWIRMHLKSKVMSDHDLIVQRLRSNDN